MNWFDVLALNFYPAFIREVKPFRHPDLSFLTNLHQRTLTNMKKHFLFAITFLIALSGVQTSTIAQNAATSFPTSSIKTALLKCPASLKDLNELRCLSGIELSGKDAKGDSCQARFAEGKIFITTRTFLGFIQLPADSSASQAQLLAYDKTFVESTNALDFAVYTKNEKLNYFGLVYASASNEESGVDSVSFGFEQATPKRGLVRCDITPGAKFAYKHMGGVSGSDV